MNKIVICICTSIRKTTDMETCWLEPTIIRPSRQNGQRNVSRSRNTLIIIYDLNVVADSTCFFRCLGLCVWPFSCMFDIHAINVAHNPRSALSFSYLRADHVKHIRNKQREGKKRNRWEVKLSRITGLFDGRRFWRKNVCGLEFD